MAARAKSKSNGFLKLPHEFMWSDRWTAMTPNERGALLCIARKHNGRNRMMIPCSVAEVAKELHACMRTARRALKDLRCKGEITAIKFGSCNGTATLWSVRFLTDKRDEK